MASNPDIHLDGSEDGYFVIPLSAAGLCWLQTHFPDEAWDSLAERLIIVPTQDAIRMAQDADQAGLLTSLRQIKD